jgi:hypothetical protein
MLNFKKLQRGSMKIFLNFFHRTHTHRTHFWRSMGDACGKKLTQIRIELKFNAYLSPRVNALQMRV